jgi:hypothetical protein
MAGQFVSKRNVKRTLDTPGIEPGTARNSQTVLSGRDKPTTPCALENILSINGNNARVPENYFHFPFSPFFFRFWHLGYSQVPEFPPIYGFNTMFQDWQSMCPCVTVFYSDLPA